MLMHILGVSALYHDSAACLIRDGRIVAAAQEERFTRKKFDVRFPTYAINYCLREGGISLKDLKYVVFYDIASDQIRAPSGDLCLVCPHGDSVFSHRPYG
jgi:predicted NodU family carbamoyl transferase